MTRSRTFALLLSTTLGGCMAHGAAARPAGSELEVTARMTPAAGFMVPRATKQLPDWEITHAVEGQFSTGGVVPSTVTVTTRDGRVELGGTVTNPIDAERARGVAMAVRGVKSVTDRIEIDAPIPDASMLQQSVVTTLLENPAVDVSQLSVSVKRGVVTLSGTARSHAASELAKNVAERVEGVHAVENAIRTSYPESPSDAVIASTVRARLEWDALVPDSSLIQLDAKDGAVRLYGTVASAAERARAARDAWVTGTTSVDVTSVAVSYAVAEGYRRESPPQQKLDEDVRDAVTRAIAADPRSSGSSLHVTVHDGVATLEGAAETLAARRAAARAAMETVGVLGIENEIEVARSHPPSARTLKREIEFGLGVHPLLQGAKMAVLTDANGRVTLDGTVQSSYQRLQAESVAMSYAGVTSVSNALLVRHETPGLTYQPHVAFFPDLEDWGEYRAAPPLVSDLRLRKRIGSRLSWDADVYAPSVMVRVQEGLVTLLGSAESLFERTRAEADAYEAGAISVDDQLRLGRIG